MVSLQCDIHILSTRDDIQVRDTDFSCFKYYEKATHGKVQGERPYSQDKSTFSGLRGQKWFLENKRPDRLRTNLKELEDLLTDQPIVFSKWRSKRKVQLVLQSGLIVNIVINKLGDVTRIHYDKWMVGKLSDGHITDIIFTNSLLIAVFLEGRMTVVSFSQPLDLTKHDSNMSNSDPKIHNIDLIGPPGRRQDRKLVLSPDNLKLLVWWTIGGHEVFPWSPQLKEEDRANLLIYSLTLNSQEPPSLTSFYRTNSDPIYFRFLQDGSSIHFLGQEVHSQTSSKRAETLVENTVLVLEHGKHVRKRASRNLSVSNMILCHCQIPNTDNVLLGTIDGSIFTFDQVENRVDNQVKAGFISTSLQCQPDGAVFLAMSEKGLVQCFDIALTPLPLCFPNEEQVTGNVLDLSQYFRSPVILKGGSWFSTDSPGSDAAVSSLVDNAMDFSFFILRFQGGPLVVLRFNCGVYSGGRMGPLQLVGQYLKYNMYHQVLLFLTQLSWDYNGHNVLMCLTTAFNAFLRLPFTREKECLLEMCLGLFHAPSKLISDEVKEDFGEQVRDLTRRLFHHLVRHGQLVKGFQLAVDINDYDLYMDIHHAATRRQAPDLAHAALVKAKAAYSRMSSEPGSRCTSSQSAMSSSGPVNTSNTYTTPLTPFQMFTRGVVGGTELMQPGMPATFHRTTAAKKISTHDFKSVDGLEEGPSGSGIKSLKYDSIISLLPLSTSSIPPTLPPPRRDMSVPPAPPPGPPPTFQTFSTSSPYVYHHPVNKDFVTTLSTEQEKLPDSSYYKNMIQIEQPHPVTPWPAPLIRRGPPSNVQTDDVRIRGHHEDTIRSQPPPSYQPPPPGAQQQSGGQEDIKVIHFGVV